MPQFPSLTSASGIWTLKKQKRAQQGSNWPPLVLPDFQFNYVTLLLHGNGTNGAQNNTFLDSSTNAFSMTRNGTITQGTFSPFGSSWSNYFDGNGDWLSISSAGSSMSLTGDFTIECWLFRQQNPSSPTYQQLFAKANNDFAFKSAVGFGWYLFDGSGYFFTTNDNAVPYNQWSHVAWVRSGSTIAMYVNGSSVGSITYASTISYNTTFTLGAGGGSEPYCGYISNFRILKGTALYTSSFTPPTAPLTAISGTSLLTCQSNQFRDASTNNFAITPTGDVSVEKFSPFLSSAEYSAATDGGSAYAAGTGYLTTTGQCLPQGTSDCCVEFWWYPMNFSNTVGFCKANVGQGIWFDYQGSGSFATVSFEVYTQGAGGVSSLFGGNAYASTGRFQVKQWNHVAYVRTGDTHSIYCNGIRLYTRTDVIGLDWAATTNNLILTSFTHQRYLNGYVSSFRSVVGSSPYDANNTTITVPTSQLTAITNTRLLLNFTNGGIIDNAMMNDLETEGNAQISTSVSRFGGGSLAFDGTGDYLRARLNDPNVNFGSGNWTVEGWVYLNNTSGTQYFVVGQSDYANASNASYSMNVTGSSAGDFFYGGSSISLGAPGLSSGVWTHCAWVRNGGTITFYRDGVSITSVSIGTNALNNGTTNPMCIGGANNGNAQLNGYIDDLRITKGVARYTANFTPPTAPFPDKGAV